MTYYENDPRISVRDTGSKSVPREIFVSIDPRAAWDGGRVYGIVGEYPQDSTESYDDFVDGLIAKVWRHIADSDGES